MPTPSPEIQAFATGFPVFLLHAGVTVVILFLAAAVYILLLVLFPLPLPLFAALGLAAMFPKSARRPPAPPAPRNDN